MSRTHQVQSRDQSPAGSCRLIPGYAAVGVPKRQGCVSGRRCLLTLSLPRGLWTESHLLSIRKIQVGRFGFGKRQFYCFYGPHRQFAIVSRWDSQHFCCWQLMTRAYRVIFRMSDQLLELILSCYMLHGFNGHVVWGWTLIDWWLQFGPRVSAGYRG